MATNLELKIELKDFRRVLGKLKKINAEYNGILKQKDIYFTVKGGLLKLRRQNGEHELIYYNRDEEGKKRWSDFEVILLNGKNIEKTFVKILNVEAVVEKTRKLFIYKGTRVHLDTVKGLGKFLELETPVTKGKREAEVRFKEIIKLLDLDTAKQIKTSYRFLIAK